MRWPNPATFGNAAQWVAAIASCCTLLIAAYGLNKAVPFFENLNLREANARLQIDNRKLEDQRQTLNADIQRFVTLGNCIIISGEMADILNRTSNAVYRLNIYLTLSDRDIPPQLSTERVIVRAIWVVGVNRPEHTWRDDQTHKSAVAAWNRVAEQFGDKLDLVIAPAAKGTIKPTQSELESARANGEVAQQLRAALDEACTALAPPVER